VALEVDGDHGVPLVLGHVHEHPVAEDPRVVDEDVEAPVALDRAADHMLGSVVVRDVVVARDRLPARGDDLVDDALRGRRVGALAAERAAEVVDDDLRARARKGERVLAADAAPGPGDDCDLAVERRHEWASYHVGTRLTSELEPPRRLGQDRVLGHSSRGGTT
jgi:hypothetical protein